MDDPDSEIPGREYGEYTCPKGHIIKSFFPKEETRICRVHGECAKRTLKRAMKNSDIPDTRLFGRFKCTKCGNEWGSASAWKNHYQQCKKCGKKVVTWNLCLLKGGGGRNLANGHLQDHCEMCKKLKRNCLYI